MADTDSEPTTPPPVRRSMTTPPPAPRKIRPTTEMTEITPPTPMRPRARRRLFGESDVTITFEQEHGQFPVLVFRRQRQIGCRNKNTLF